MSNQTSNNNKRIAKNTLLPLLPNALYDGGVAVHEPSHIECVGSGKLRNIQCGRWSRGDVLSHIRIIVRNHQPIHHIRVRKGRQSKLNKIFSASVTIQLLLSLIIVVMIESVGVWFLNAKMTIPAERMTAANWVL